jgi:hypothetical protein
MATWEGLQHSGTCCCVSDHTIAVAVAVVKTLYALVMFWFLNACGFLDVLIVIVRIHTIEK